MEKKYKITIDQLGEVEINEKMIRRCYLRVYPNGKITASVPHNYGKQRTERFIATHKKWVLDKLVEINDKSQKIYYKGDEITLAEQSAVKIMQFYETKRKEAYSLFRSILTIYIDKYPLFSPAPILKIRSMVSWGLYNKTKNQITLNLKLIQADIESIKMVVFHELCHMIEQNHSSKFYALLKQEFPHYKVIKKRMKNYNTRF